MTSHLAFSFTRSIIGMQAKTVSVEVHISPGLPAFTIVGLPETAVRESRDRVRSAIQNSQFEFPWRHITVNLAPADLPKTGSGFDLPIAIGILAASGQIPPGCLGDYEFIGELALSGNLRGVPGILPAVIAAKQDGRHLIIAHENGAEAGLADTGGVSAAGSLREVCAFLCGDAEPAPLPRQAAPAIDEGAPDWSDVKGQQHAKYALEIAAAGGHSVLMSGTPGSGKTMLARRFSTLLPWLDETRALECAAIRSVHGRPLDYSRWREPPFRAPHHTASAVAMVGGGNPPKPGEISLAHHGVLFLDELPEFHKQVLETLREPLESGTVHISRAAATAEFPARFQLVAAMNPCPCGQWGNPNATCVCPPDKITRYFSRLSAPLMDRIDMHLAIQPVKLELLTASKPESVRESPRIREQVEALQRVQFTRQGCLNAALGPAECESVCALDEAGRTFVAQAMERLKLSARSFHRLLKVARTIADKKEEAAVSVSALQQALTFRDNLRPSVRQ
ncbi:competence related protein ComM [Legionella geestiana]|uniref:Competence related protein ComM n=1 Tax=Legionella geestiana TaxID=45065 RepID=A0A0W0TUF5_9GAMM|nr:YifB family Mg chelatase-like AAA ATPase [Legionella geestiana]KTC99003.1 competence related protein ComM [Legionella geestiana]QBS12662.1 ATP-binding protein [Legionella geestiana]STX54875.1 ComM, competence-like protein [Legionella geestiana]